MLILIQILFAILIIATIKTIKNGKIKYPIESYLISIVIYTIIIMLLF